MEDDFFEAQEAYEDPIMSILDALDPQEDDENESDTLLDELDWDERRTLVGRINHFRFENLIDLTGVSPVAEDADKALVRLLNALDPHDEWGDYEGEL